jgi:hypothetical protein
MLLRVKLRWGVCCFENLRFLVPMIWRLQQVLYDNDAIDIGPLTLGDKSLIA